MELSTPKKKSKKHQSHLTLLLSGSTLSTHSTISHTAECDWRRPARADECGTGPLGPPSRQTWSCGCMYEHTQSLACHACMHAYCTTLIPPPPAQPITCAPTLHFPVCCRRLSPSCCQTPGHLWNSLHRSHLTPALEGNKSGRWGGIDGWQVYQTAGWFNWGRAWIDGWMDTLSHLSRRRKTLLRCSSWAIRHTRRDYADVMFPPSACPRGAASPQTSQTAKHAHCKKKNYM